MPEPIGPHFRFNSTKGRYLVRTAIALGISVLIVSLIQAQQPSPQDEARDIIRKSLKAMGVKEDAAMPKGLRLKAKGTLEVMGVSLDITQDVVIRFPNQFKESLELNVNGMTIPVVTIFDGKKGSIEANGKRVKVDEKILGELKEAGNLMSLGQLTPLLDKKWDLSLVGEVKVEDKPALGVRVSGKGKGFKDINLFFDKKSGLLVKMERTALNVETGNDVQEERIIKGYQEKDGRKVPSKVVVFRDGKQLIEAEVTEYSFMDQIDAGEFAIPKEEKGDKGEK